MLALLLCKLSVFALGTGDDHAAECKQRNHVWNDHELIEHVGQLPDQIVGQAGTKEDKHDCNSRINLAGSLAAKQEVDVDAAKEVPTDDGGEGEEQQADGDYTVAEGGAEYLTEGQLSHIGLGDTVCGAGGQNAVAGIERGDDDKRGHGQHHEGVNKHTDHGDDTLIVGLLYLGNGVGMGSGAHAGLIGKQAALDALADGGLQRIAKAAADDGIGFKSILEDHTEGLGDVADAGDQDNEAKEQIEGSHDRHQLFGHRGDPVDTAEEDKTSQSRDDQAHDPAGNAERIGAGLGDGVGLHHAAHETQSQNDGNGEEYCQEAAKLVVERLLDVEHGAAGNAAVLVDDPGLLCQYGFGIDGGHAEKGDDPHPEDCAGTADQNCTAGADNVAGSDLGGNGSGQRLEGAHAALVLTAVHIEVPKYLAHALAEASHLHKAGPDGEVEAGGYQKDH